MIQLTKREKIIGLTLVALSLLLSLYIFVIEPVAERVNTLSRVIPRKQNELVKLREKADEYLILHSKLDDLRTEIASQKKTLRLLPLLETQLKKCELSNNIITMKQQVLPLRNGYEKRIVEIRLKELSLAQIIDFLAKIKSSNTLVKADTLHIKKNQTKKQKLDATIEVYTIKYGII